MKSVSEGTTLPRLRNRLVHEEENRLFWCQLNSFADDPHELCNGDIIRHEKFAFVDVRNLRFGDPFNDDLQVQNSTFDDKFFPDGNFLTGIRSGYFRRIFSASCLRWSREEENRIFEEKFVASTDLLAFLP